MARRRFDRTLISNGRAISLTRDSTRGSDFDYKFPFSDDIRNLWHLRYCTNVVNLENRACSTRRKVGDARFVTEKEDLSRCPLGTIPVLNRDLPRENFYIAPSRNAAVNDIGRTVAELPPRAETKVRKGFQAATLRANISPCYGLELLNGKLNTVVAGKASVQSTLCSPLAGLITSPQLAPSPSRSS